MLLRRARVSDAEAIGEIHVQTWRAAYRGLIPQAYLDGLDPAERQRVWAERIREARPPTTMTVLEDDAGAVIGFVACSASRDDDSDRATVGQVMAIYLRPAHWGTGRGRLLISGALDELTAAGFREATLWVLATNERARRFYEAGGWRPDGTITTEDSLGIPLVEARYRRPLP